MIWPGSRATHGTKSAVKKIYVPRPKAPALIELEAISDVWPIFAPCAGNMQSHKPQALAFISMRFKAQGLQTRPAYEATRRLRCIASRVLHCWSWPVSVRLMHALKWQRQMTICLLRHVKIECHCSQTLSRNPPGQRRERGHIVQFLRTMQAHSHLITITTLRIRDETARPGWACSCAESTSQNPR